MKSRIYRSVLWVLVMLLLVSAIWFRESRNAALWAELEEEQVFWESLPEEYLSHCFFFLIMAAVFSAIRELPRKKERKFCVAELLLWCMVLVYYTGVHFKSLQWYPSQPWLYEAALTTMGKFTPLIVYFYGIRCLYRNWPELAAEWNSNRPLWAKPLFSMEIIVFGGIRRANTMAGKVLYVLGLGYFVYLILLSTTQYSFPCNVMQALNRAFEVCLIQFWPAVSLFLGWWLTEEWK